MENSNLNNKSSVVLKELIKNSKMSSAELGKKLNVTRQTISKIIKKLEDDKTIWGYTVIASEKSNYYGDRKHYLALVKTNDITGLIKNIKNMILDKEKTRKILKDSNADLAFDVAVFYHGEYDFVVAFFANSLFDAKKFLKLMTDYNKDIVEIQLLQPLLVARRGGFINPKLQAECEALGID